MTMDGELIQVVLRRKQTIRIGVRLPQTRRGHSSRMMNTVICTGARRTWYPMFRREAIVLSAKVVEGLHTGTVLERYFPAGERIGRGSNYYREWVIANQGLAPRRRERMPMKKFVGKLFRAQVVTVVIGRDGSQLTGASYSKIARIIELQVTNEASQ